MAEAVYILCAVTSVACVMLLLRSYRKQRTRLLLWSTLCFGGLAVNNILMVVDLIIVPSSDMSLFRTGSGFVAIVLLLIGLTWEDS